MVARVLQEIQCRSAVTAAQATAVLQVLVLMEAGMVTKAIQI